MVLLNFPVFGEELNNRQFICEIRGGLISFGLEYVITFVLRAN